MHDGNAIGDYRIIGELGQGGMADVYLAAVEGPAGTGFTKLAVVKKLRRHLAEDPAFVAMLMDEARITARLTHPNVVQIFEVGECDGTFFLAMEYLDGQPLHRITQRIERWSKSTQQPVPREIYYAVVSDVLAGLHHAHTLADYDGTPWNVVHRDVTPHNVFVTYDGAIKVVDFGIAKAVGRATETQHGVVKGKIRYMSPEQANAKTVDRRTDIFASGVILWNVATGGMLWDTRDDLAVACALYEGTYPASPRELYPEVPEAIDAICRKALAHRPEDRYASAAEMRHDLEAFLGPATAQARRQLATMMRQLFERDRVKVRAVIEAAQLGGPASSAALGLARRVTKPASPAHTSPSASPVAVSTTPRERAATPRRRGVAESAIAAAVIAICIGILMISRRPKDVEPSEHLAGPAEVQAEIETLARPLLSKTDHSTTALANAPPLASARKGAPASTGKDSSAAPHAHGSSNAAPVDAPPTRAGLDTADPWSARRAASAAPLVPPAPSD